MIEYYLCPECNKILYISPILPNAKRYRPACKPCGRIMRQVSTSTLPIINALTELRYHVSECTLPEPLYDNTCKYITTVHPGCISLGYQDLGACKRGFFKLIPMPFGHSPLKTLFEQLNNGGSCTIFLNKFLELNHTWILAGSYDIIRSKSTDEILAISPRINIAVVSESTYLALSVQSIRVIQGTAIYSDIAKICDMIYNAIPTLLRSTENNTKYYDPVDFLECHHTQVLSLPIEIGGEN